MKHPEQSHPSSTAGSTMAPHSSLIRSLQSHSLRQHPLLTWVDSDLWVHQKYAYPGALERDCMVSHVTARTPQDSFKASGLSIPFPPSSEQTLTSTITAHSRVFPTHCPSSNTVYWTLNALVADGRLPHLVLTTALWSRRYCSKHSAMRTLILKKGWDAQGPATELVPDTELGSGCLDYGTALPGLGLIGLSELLVAHWLTLHRPAWNWNVFMFSVISRTRTDFCRHQQLQVHVWCCSTLPPPPPCLSLQPLFVPCVQTIKCHTLLWWPARPVD